MKSVMVPARGAATILAALVLTSCHENTAPLGPAQVAFTVSPSTTTVGLRIKPAVQVAIQDVNGQTVSGAANTVTLTLINPAGATLSGATTVRAINGVATFGDLSIDKEAAQYALTASSGDLASATSAYFTITGPTRLAFTSEPSTTPAGVAITPAVQVAIRDALGNTVPNATNAVTVTLANNPASGTLSGSTTVNAVNGVATFTNLSIDNVSTGYRLAASSGALTSATSASFNVTAPPTSLHVVTTTTGASFPGSYLLSIDCDSYSYSCRYNSPIAVNGAVTVSVPQGHHYVTLDVAENCAVTGEYARDVSAYGPTEVPFAVTCAGVGTVRVSTTTSGTDLTPDGYSVCIDRVGTDCYWHAQARANDVITIGRVTSGAHTVTLTGIGGNCTVGSGAAHAVTVPVDATVSASFDISCAASERIAFSLGATISMVHADGTAPRVITGGLAPAWSPDGATLAYECGQDICAINADGTNQRQVTSSDLRGGAGNHHPTWSPDGLRIAFASNAAASTDLYVVAASGGSAVRLTNGVGFVGNPAWSPDGTQIAFDCEIDAGNIDICVVKADGTGLARVTSDPARDRGAAWKPDGSTLAFATARFGVDEIVFMSPSGGSVTRIGGGLPGVTPTWSPDGTQLAFVQPYYDASSGPADAVFVARTDGSNLQAVTRGAQPAWRPHR